MFACGDCIVRFKKRKTTPKSRVSKKTQEVAKAPGSSLFRTAFAKPKEGKKKPIGIVHLSDDDVSFQVKLKQLGLRQCDHRRGPVARHDKHIH